MTSVIKYQLSPLASYPGSKASKLTLLDVKNTILCTCTHSMVPTNLRMRNSIESARRRSCYFANSFHVVMFNSLEGPAGMNTKERRYHIWFTPISTVHLVAKLSGSY